MSVFTDTQRPSFRGVPFLVNSESEEGGKKTATHEYPNSNKRFTEQFGEIPPKFTVNAIIKGNDAINQRIRLRNALNEDGLGTLVHPVYGVIEVKSTSFTINSNQQKTGEFLFTIRFETTEPSVTPIPSATNSFTVSNSADVARTTLDATIKETYQPPTSGDSLNASAAKMAEISAGISSQVNNIKEPDQDGVASFTRVDNQIEATLFTIVQSAGPMGDSLTALYSSFLTIGKTPSDILIAWQRLTEFNSDSATLPTDTFQRREIANNENILNEHTRLTALAGAFESVAYIGFTTDEQLLQFQDFLDLTYNELLRDSISDVSVSDTTVIALDPAVRNAFAILRDNTRKTLDQLKENVWRVVDIARLRSSIPLTAYRYYGNIDNIELLTSLNPDVNVSGFDKSIKGVTK